MTNYRFCWHWDTQATIDLAHSSHTCSTPQAASLLVTPSPLTCSHLTRWDTLREQEPLRNQTWCPSCAVPFCMPNTVTSHENLCLCSQKGSVRLWAQQNFTDDTGHIVFGFRENGQPLTSAFLSTDQYQRLKTKAMTHLSLKIPNPIMQKHQID